MDDVWCQRVGSVLEVTDKSRVKKCRRGKIGGGKVSDGGWRDRDGKKWEESL